MGVSLKSGTPIVFGNFHKEMGKSVNKLKNIAKSTSNKPKICYNIGSADG